MHRSILLLAVCVGLSACGTSTTPVATTGGDRHVQNLCWGCNPIPMPGRPAYPVAPVVTPVEQPPVEQPPAVEPTAAPEVPGGGGGGDETPPPAEEPQQTATVVLKDFEFVPARVIVAPGTTVTWKFEGPAPHTSTSDPSSSVPWDSGKKDAGTTFSMKFDTQGAFSYHCELHPQMHGTVIVTPAGSGNGGGANEGEGQGEQGGGESGGGDAGGDTGGGGY